MNRTQTNDLAAATPAVPSAQVAAVLDWASLQQPAPDAPAKAEPRSSPIDDHALYHIQGADQCRSLALAIEGEYYRYYRNRPDFNKAQTLVQHLHQQGKRALATWDDNGYVVWVHQPERPQQAVPWQGRLATG